MAGDDNDGDGMRRWAIGRALSNWRKVQPMQLRDVLPGDFSCSRLRLIRANACRESARETGVLINCAKWTSRTATDGASIQVVTRHPVMRSLSKAERRGFSTRKEYNVCKPCKHPVVTNSVLIERLGLTRDDEDFSERTWRRYINDAKPIRVAQWRRIVSNAFAHGWLDLRQSMLIWKQTNQLHATQSGLRAIFQRISERKSFKIGKFDVSAQEVRLEFAKQGRLIDRAATDAIHTRLQRVELSADERELLTELRNDGLTAEAAKT